MTDNQRFGTGLFGAALGLGARLDWTLADAEEAKARYDAAYQMLVGEVPPPDDEVLAGAAKIVRLAQDVAMSGNGAFGDVLAALRSLLIDGSPHLSMHDALRRFGRESGDGVD